MTLFLVCDVLVLWSHACLLYIFHNMLISWSNDIVKSLGRESQTSRRMIQKKHVCPCTRVNIQFKGSFNLYF